MKKIIISLFVLLAAVNAFAQSDDDLFGDDSFFMDDAFDTFDTFSSGDDSFFSSDDDMFFDDGIEEYHESSNKTDLAKGIIFEDGSVKLGGSFSTSVDMSTVLYDKTQKDFADNLKNTTLIPFIGADISLDARPNQDLRLYTKVSTSTEDLFDVKEMFTDFTTSDNISFRFGLHTVTWGTGVFYSPVSDMINTSSIDPEHTDLQVDGSINLRTLVTIPGTMNSLWFYVIPDLGTKLAIDTALAAKYEFLVGGWEFGTGAFYKYETAPKIMLTASGSVKKVSLFGEAVYQYGSDREWIEKKSFDDKSSVLKATAGFSYMKSDPSIMIMAQYFYDGNDFAVNNLMDYAFYFSNLGLIKEFSTKGHNVAAMLNFGKLFDNDKLSFSVLGIAHLTKPKIHVLTPLEEQFSQNMLGEEGYKLLQTAINSVKATSIAIFNATLNYSPVDNVSMNIGPSILVSDWKKEPQVLLKIGFTLGGGNF